MNVSRVAQLPERRPVITLLGCVLASELVGASGSVFTATGPGSWYAGLVQPPFAPPGWVFAPVWTTLFALMGGAVWLVWRAAPGPGVRVALALFVGQFVLNVAWSAAFFGAQSPLAGLVVIAALWLAIVATVAAFARVDRRAALLLVPYLAWVTFAAVLNYGFWRLN